MKIIGFSINKLLVERKNPIKGKLNLKSGLNIEDIKEEKVSVSDKPSLKFDFVYNIDYAPNIAKIEIKGSVIALDDKDEGKDILKEWKKKKFSHKVKLPLLNFILNKCSIKAIQLEDELGLPTHVNFPKLKPKSTNKASYTG